MSLQFDGQVDPRGFNTDGPTPALKFQDKSVRAPPERSDATIVKRPNTQEYYNNGL
jgi:hypothetical protein